MGGWSEATGHISVFETYHVCGLSCLASSSLLGFVRQACIMMTSIAYFKAYLRYAFDIYMVRCAF